MDSILKRLVNNEYLTRDEAKDLLLDITSEKYNQIEISGILTAFAMRGVSVEELIGFRAALLSTRIPIDLSEFSPIDIVGTGGDGKNTFNISTCACFVVAGTGKHVAKHGNGSATSISGASDVLKQHGVKFSNRQEDLTRSMEESGVAYLHAPLFNPAMKSVAPIRKDLHIATFFNLCGPLINPAQPTFQLLGVANLEQMRLYTQTLTECGIQFTVVTSLDGYDEASLTDDFKIMTNEAEHIYNIETLGFAKARPEELSGGKTQAEAKDIFDAVLENRALPAQRDVVILNAALALGTMTSGSSLEECIASARESLESGKALEQFKKFLNANQ